MKNNLKYSAYLFFLLFNVQPAYSQIENVLVLDGCTNYFEVPENDLLDYSQVLSIECWIEPNCENENSIIVSKQWCQGEYGYYLSVNNGKLFWSYSINSFCTSPNNYQTISTEILPHQFTHVAVVHKQNQIKLFINGNEVASQLLQGNLGIISNSSEPFRIGAYRKVNGDLSNFYSGLIDEIRVWDIELNESLIQQRMNNTLNGNEPGLILYLDMEETGQGPSLVLENQSSLGNSLNAFPTGFTSYSPYITYHEDYAENIIDLGSDLISCDNFVTISIDTGNYKSVLWSNGQTENSITISNSGSYSVVVETDRCKFHSDTINLELSNASLISSEYLICENDTIILNNIAYFNEGVYFDTITSGGVCDTIYEYTISIIPSTSEFIQIEACPNSIVIFNGEELESGSITSFVLTNLNGCDSILTIEITPSLILTEELNISSCEGSQIEYNGTILYPNSSTEFVFLSTEGCDSIVTVNVETNPTINDFLGNDSIICDELYFLYSPNENTLWSNGTISGSINVTSPGIYYGSFTDSSGCINSDTIFISEIGSPSLNLGNDTTICENDTILLYADHPDATGYIWQDGSTNSSFIVNQTGNYAVTITDNNNCIATDSVSITLDNSICPPCPLFGIPNVFTPDDDQSNDFFFVFSDGEFEIIDFKVYSRWGNLVHNSHEPWDGTYKDEAVPSDVYIYMLTLKTECEMKQFSGDITLIR